MASEYPTHSRLYFERRDALLGVEPLNEDTCLTLICDQRALGAVRHHILVMCIRQVEGDGHITRRQAAMVREIMDGDSYEEVAKAHSCHRNTVVNQVARAMRAIRASLPDDDARDLFELLLEVFGAHVMRLAGYCRPA